MSNTVNTKYGDVIGTDHGEYVTYFGIPFAKPPVGKLRFEPPKEPDYHDEPIVADHFREKAIQQELGDLELWGKEFYQNPEYNVKPSEDCLYLNIWAPKDAEGCPVAVWIHGGALKNGYACEMEFDGLSYAKRGVILVTIAYRCNLFGFLPIPGEENSANLGLKDQIQALKWVKENISGFGGDSDNITLFGQSAGARSVLHLCNTPYTKGLISKAILQSGATYNADIDRMMDISTAEKVYEDLLKAAGCSGIDELKKIPAIKLYEIFDSLPIMKQIGILNPVVDKEIVKTSVDDSIAGGNMHNIPYIIGGNKNDLWMDNSTVSHPSGELWKGMCNLCDELVRQNRPVYLYYFAHDLPGNNEGAFHSAELWYMFGTLQRSWRPMTSEDYELSEKMLDAWTRFMKTGNPNNEGDTVWEQWPYSYNTYV